MSRLDLSNACIDQHNANISYARYNALAQYQNALLGQQSWLNALLGQQSWLNPLQNRFQHSSEMQMLLARQQQERSALEQELYNRDMRRQKEIEAFMQHMDDAVRIDAAPDLWRRLDAARARLDASNRKHLISWKP